MPRIPSAEAIKALQDAVLQKPVSLQTIDRAANRAANIDWHMLRLDQVDHELSGNKLFKLLPYLQQAQAQGSRHLLSFGGMHSNHLYALAQAGKRCGFNTIAVVRGYAAQAETPTLKDLKTLGMQIHFAGREEYAKRYEANYQADLSKRYNHALVINEGGAGAQGVEGAQLMADFICRHLPQMPDYLVIPAGTGTSFLGLLNCATLQKCHMLAVAALHNCQSLYELAQTSIHPHWQIVDGFQCGGFAKVNSDLAKFMQDFEREQSLVLDPVYTGKMCFAIEQLIERGSIKAGSRVVSLHTGGLQGRRALSAKLEELAKC